MSARLAGVLLLPLSAAAFADGGTVGDMTQRHHNSGWLSRVVVRTPSILPEAPESKLPADFDEAIAQYDRVIELSGDKATRAEAMRRGAYLRVRAAETDPSAPQSLQALQRAIELYTRVLADAPDDAGNDRAHYQLARAYELLGDTAQASTELATLARRYPESPLAGDAHFRAGELLYLLKQYADAEAEYRAVVARGDETPYRRFAAYKYGWTLYRQAKFEEALAPFLSLLDAEPEASELRADTLHVTSLAFAALGNDGIANYFAHHGGEPRYAAMLYLAVGAQQEEMRRYTDAASTFASYVAHHPGDASAPRFQARAIGAYEQGGFPDEVLRAKSDYVAHFGPESPQWKQHASDDGLAKTLRGYLDDIAQTLHARAQHAPASDEGRQLFAAAADAYRRRLEWFPNDARAPEINLLYADALLDGGDLAQAARQYARTAFDYPPHAKSSEAALAAVQTEQALAERADAAQRPAALRESIATSLKFADVFPQHAQWTHVLAAAASQDVELGNWDQALALAQRVLASGKPMTTDVRARMLGVDGDGQFAAGHFAEAERAYTTLLATIDSRDPQRRPVTEQLAASIYRQAEAARAAGDLRAAANGFQRVSRVTPGASICATADYDAAAALIALQDWSSARLQLEMFRARYPGHALSVDVDKKLAVADQNDHQPLQAAEVYARIARASSESVAERADAALLSAQLFDQAGAITQAASAYQSYLAGFAVTPERRVDILQRLADIAHDGGDEAAYRRTLEQIVATDAAAGNERTHARAAHATLEIGRMQAQAARQVALSQPLAKSLSRRKAATDAAIATLLKAANYRLADVTPAASYEVGRIYTEFADALVHSERPRHLKGAALEQYQLLLEEQSDPFEEKAIAAHESNLARLHDDVWNEAIRGSADQLSALVPGRYGKREINEAADDSLR